MTMIIAKLKNDIIQSIAGKKEFNKCKASRNRKEKQSLNLLKQSLKQDFVFKWNNANLEKRVLFHL